MVRLSALQLTIKIALDQVFGHNEETSNKKIMTSL